MLFYNDEVAVGISGSSTKMAATSTAITDVRQGQRMIVKFNVDFASSSAASTTIPFKLQYENNTDSPDSWADVSSTTPIKPSLGSFGRNRVGGSMIATTTAEQVLNTCSTAGTYREGYAQWGDYTSLPPLTLEDDECTDLAFSIHTASTTLGKTYRLRLINASTSAALDDYQQYPTLTIASSAGTTTVSKQTYGPATTTSAWTVDDPTNGVGEQTQIVIGLDGNPVIAYQDYTDNEIRVTKCNDPKCVGGDETSTIIDTPGSPLGDGLSMTLGVDGNPIMSYQEGDNPNGALRVAKCTDPACTGTVIATTVDDPANSVAQYTSISIGADGNPIISYGDRSDWTHNVVTCNDMTCSGGDELITSYDPSPQLPGEHISMVIGLDGNPVISYYDWLDLALRVLKCDDPTCDGVGEIDSMVDHTTSGIGRYSQLVLDCVP